MNELTKDEKDIFYTAFYEDFVIFGYDPLS